jgi:hypothetical protein
MSSRSPGVIDRRHDNAGKVSVANGRDHKLAWLPPPQGVSPTRLCRGSSCCCTRHKRVLIWANASTRPTDGRH